MADDEGMVDIDKVLGIADTFLDDVEAFDEQAVAGVKKMLEGGLMLADSLADDTLVDKAFDVDG